jgi:hypothetical protein
MVVAVHGLTANTFAVLPALEVVPAHIAEMLMRAFVVQIFDTVGFRHEPATYGCGIQVPSLSQRLAGIVHKTQSADRHL